VTEYDPALDEDFTAEEIAAIEAILDDSASRKHGEDVLAAVEASDNARQGLDPLLAALDQAHRAKLEAEGGQQK
jgi:hypothetical protein